MQQDQDADDIVRGLISGQQRHAVTDALMQHSRSSLSEICLATHGRAIHFGTKTKCRDAV